MKKFVLWFLIFYSQVLYAQQDSVAPIIDSNTQTGQQSEITNVQNDSSNHSAQIQIQANSNSINNTEDKNDTNIQGQKMAPSFYDTLFSIHKTEPAADHILQYHKKNTSYTLPVILFLLLLYFTILRYRYAKQIRENITVLLNMNLGQQIYRDREFSFNIFSILLYFNTILIIGMYCYLLSGYFHIKLPFHSIFLNVLLCSAIFPAAYFIKTIIYILLKLIFEFDIAVQFFRFNTLIIYQLLAVALLPCVILIATVQEPGLHWVVAVSISLAALALILRFIKGITVGITFTRFHILYFLLYICALEIAPLLIVYKAFTLISA
ncbi:MAG: DUF4271 domain-containing protein [Fimbriimonadaceae bacterium]|nr:DUF4271 domain-containing protein [Chitinophagales bacterium]